MFAKLFSAFTTCRDSVRQYDPICKPAAALAIEPLEGRRLCSAGAVPVTFTGSSGPEFIELSVVGTELHVRTAPWIDQPSKLAMRIALDKVASISVFAGDGNDMVIARPGVKNALIYGEGGHDQLFGNEQDCVIFGGDGWDYIIAGSGNDVVLGGDGNDTILGGFGHDHLYGGPGDDFMAGQEGNDQLVGEAGNDNLNGDNGNDHLLGMAGHDLLQGGAGNDRLEGGDDDDGLDGEDGNDTVYGGNGNDILVGGHGQDVLYGEAGDDRFFAYDGEEDTLFGGTGFDRADVDRRSNPFFFWEAHDALIDIEGSIF